MCKLCKRDIKSISRILIHYSYLKDFWEEVEQIMGMDNLCNGESVEDIFRKWINKNELKKFISIPCIFI
jgi:hypothetical protein